MVMRHSTEELTMLDDWLTAEFEAHRPRLRAIAYRMLGSHAEADDALQETWLRLHGNAQAISNLGGWLTTVTTRLCLDRLRARRARHEDASGVRLPSQLADAGVVDDPAGNALVAESVSVALLVVLDALTPAERVSFVLHDVFAVPFDEIGPSIDRTPEATRQLASRARRRLQGASPPVDVNPLRQREIVDTFLHAARGGDIDTLLRLLDPDVVLQPDAAAEHMGSLRLTRGAPQVASALSGGAQAAQLAIVDGLAGLVWAPRGMTRGVIEFTLRNERIVAIRVTGNTQTIDRLDIVTLGR
jgi:RNA polymerase sigma factor (sigma-70 family)